MEIYIAYNLTQYPLLYFILSISVNHLFICLFFSGGGLLSYCNFHGINTKHSLYVLLGCGLTWRPSCAIWRDRDSTLRLPRHLSRLFAAASYSLSITVHLWLTSLLSINSSYYPSFAYWRSTDYWLVGQSDNFSSDSTSLVGTTSC